ncbi:hypothetical protein [Rhodococcoides yunnanense]|uniref:Uncharacterized protein n=1 Tax=Rhodococcoides yunnanense TaxID=278209 RepID=A0ABU4B6L9_9NOCA|nr:hypothetical protein [Rhodococcus yunnanensis]MDV6259832.1 hypothetical protein [Rhodococcus yunnanensis]
MDDRDARRRHDEQELARTMREQRTLSPIFATLVIVGVLAVPRLDLPWAGIAGWGLAIIAAVAWLVTALWLPRAKDTSATSDRDFAQG